MINLLTSLMHLSPQCLCAFPIVTSFRERSLQRSLCRSLYRSLQTPSLSLATSLPEREGKDYRRVIVVPPLPLGEGYQLAGWEGVVTSKWPFSKRGHYPQPSIHAPWERFSDLRRLLFKILCNFPNIPYVTKLGWKIQKHAVSVPFLRLFRRNYWAELSPFQVNSDKWNNR